MAGGIDPISLASSGIQTVGGIAQSIIGGIKQHRALKSLEKLKTPTYTPNKAINDYYQSALQRYNTSPYQSAEYNYALQRNQQNQASAFAGLRDRRNSLAGAASIVNAGNNADMRAGIQAEANRSANFGALGSATGMKVGDDRMAFQQNLLSPYEKKAGLLTNKAAAAGQMLNAGLSNIFGGIGNGAAIASASNDGMSSPASQAFAPSYGGLQGNQIPDTYSQYGGTYLPAGLRYKGY